MPRIIKVGERQLDLGGKYLSDALRDSSDALHDGAALRSRMAQDGYLLMRGLQNRDQVLAARHRILEFINEQGCLKPGANLDDALVNPDLKRHPHTMGNKAITHDPLVRRVLESKEIFDFFTTLFGKTPRTYDYKWMRCVKQPDFTGAHYDVVYMGRGTQSKLFTVWTPLCDIPLELGPLAICAGSHNSPSFAKVRETYGRMDVDRDRVSGWFANDPVDVIDRYGGQWLTSSFRAGDVLVFGMFTLHMSVPNTTNIWRISSDTRFQPADEPIDERWVGENPKAHYAWYSEPEKMVSMEKKKVEWGV